MEVQCRKISIIAVLLYFWLFPSTAQADNCSGLSDCFNGNIIPAILLILGLLLLITAPWWLGPLLARFALGAALRSLFTTAVRSGAVAAAARVMRKGFSRVPKVNFGNKIQKQLGKRGWTEKSVRDTIRSPDRRVPTRDTRYRSDGSRNNDPATAYVNKDGSYVVRNDRTGDIVQVSNRNDPNFKPPF